MHRSSVRRRLTLTASAFALATAAPGIAPAGVFSWNGGTGAYVDPTQWTPNGVPGGGDDAQVYAPASVVQVFNTGQSVGTLELGSAKNSGEQLVLNNSAFFVDQNALTNNGLITIASGSQLTSGSGTVTFGGTGTITLDDSAGSAILGTQGGEVFGTGQVVQGAGNIGNNNTIITNNGLISGNVNNATAAQTLDIDPAGGNGGVGAGNGFGTNGNSGLYNTGTIQATGGGVVNLYGGLYENSATGLIQAETGSTVNLQNDVRILNGTLTTAGTGVIDAINGTQYLQTVTLSSGSNLSVSNDGLFINTGLTNNGTVTLANGSYMTPETASATISGTGTIVVNSGTTLGTQNALVLGANQTVVGAGNVGNNNTVITNNGLISGNVAGGDLVIDPAGGNGGVGAGNGVGTNGNSAFYNTGTVQANGATAALTLNGGQYDNTGALMQAVNGGSLVLGNDVRIISGTLTSDATSAISASGGIQYLQNTTLSSGSNLSVSNDGLFINTGLTNNGTVTLANGSYMTPETASATIGGTGTIVVNSGTTLGTQNALVLGANQTVVGAGNVGNNNTVITNNGLISGNVAGGDLVIDPAGGNGGVSGGLGSGGGAAFLNAGTVQANGAAAALTLNGGQYDNTGALMQAVNGGSLVLGNDVRIISGTLTSDATSAISASGGIQYLQNTTLSSGSNLSVSNDGLFINTGLTNNGTVTLANGSYMTPETASATISGTGTIVVNSGTTLGTQNALVLGANQTVVGAGNIGNNNTIITNNGLISGNVNNATAAQTLDIDPAGGNGGVGAGNGFGTNGNSGLYNTGTIQATGGGVVNLYGGLYENSATGLIQAETGSTVNLQNDVRILNGTLTTAGTGVIDAINGIQYLQTVTLSSGSNLSVSNDGLFINTGLTNNGTVTLANGSYMTPETASATIGGTGTIVVNSGTTLGTQNALVLGANQTVVGAGNVGNNNTVITNNGVISGNVAGGDLVIDPAGGNGGVGAGNGVGTNGNSAFYNTGTVQSANTGTTTLDSGLYENSATGTLAALTGSTTNMASDTSLYNLQAGGVLAGGNYTSATTGAASVLNLQSNQANSIVTIGTSAPTTDTVVTLSGANSQLNVYTFNQGAPTPIDASLTMVAQSGKLVIENGRVFDPTANGGAFSNAGVVQLAAGTFGPASYANSGLTTGSGTVTAPISNTGTVEAAGGALATQAITGGAGTIRTLAGATLDLTAATAESTAGELTDNGALALGSQSLLVTSDYTNANFGSGNAFNRRANVTGSGDIYGVSYTEDLSGPALSGATIDAGNVRTGGSSSTTLTITNNGTATNIIGAVQNTNAPSIAIDNQDFTAAHGGGSATVTLSYTGTTAGALNGQSITVVNNFANIGPKTIAVTGNVYQIAEAGSQPATLSLGAARVGDTGPSSSLTIANVAPNTPGYTESLTSTASTSSPFRINGGSSATASNVAAGSSSPVSVSLATATAGAFSGTVGISNTSIPVAGSGFSPLPLAGQSVSVSGNVYAPAVANLSSNTVSFGVVRGGTAGPTQSLSLTNASTGALSDVLVSSVGATPAGVSVTTPESLAQGARDSVGFNLSTATPGQVSGQATLDFTSHDSQLADLALPSQQVNVSGTVTQVAQALITNDAGVGTITSGGQTYTLNLGSFMSNSGTDTATLGLTNDIPASTYAEMLNGSFASQSAAGYSFNGQAFTGLAGGAHTSGDLINFNTDGLGAGTYTDVLTFMGYSSYSGLSNDELQPITVDVTAQITGGGGGGVSAAPEPKTWALMIAGLGLIGARLRRGVSRRARRQVALS